jgi:hypothetical protein
VNPRAGLVRELRRAVEELVSSQLVQGELCTLYFT